jgi:two-component system phosphate regulon sensor histidine kinase PhoR
METLGIHSNAYALALLKTTHEKVTRRMRSLSADLASRARPAAIVGVLWRGQSYLNLLYLLAAFPLGLIYFVLLITLLSTGFGSVVALIGIPILWGTLYVWLGLAEFERQLTSWWLGVPIQRMPLLTEPGVSYWKRLQARLSSRVTWTGLLYLFLKGIFGTAVFVLLVALIALTAGLITAPLPYLLQATVGDGLEPGRATLALLSPLLTLLGVVVGLVTLLLSDGLAFLWGRFAQITLGVSDEALRLEEARAATRRAQSQAAQADQSRRELIVNVSHELRTPIANIRGHAESLLLASEAAEGAAASPEETKRYLTIIARESERLSALVDDLLALARAEAGELRLEIRPVSVNGVFDEVYEALAPLARRERQVTLTREAVENAPPVLADRQRLAQVLLNLARNAIAYTPAGGIVSLAVERPDHYHLSLVVADTGVGIPQEELDRVFERFYRADASRARATGGFGLGLAIVRDLVQAMGGVVTAQSVVGQGSRFIVTLPIAPESAPVAGTSA